MHFLTVFIIAFPALCGALILINRALDFTQDKKPLDQPPGCY